MEDIVCVKLKQKGKRSVYLLTWGRVFDPADPAPLFQALKSGLKSFGLKETDSLQLCSSISEGRREKYFYEGLLSFAHRPIPFGTKTYRAWANKMRRAIRAGKEIFVITDR